MPLPPTLLKPLADAIGKAFTRDEVEELVLLATGNKLFVIYAAPDDPTSRAVLRTLEQLGNEGAERWLLTQVLASAVSNVALRRMIVKACPETLVSLPSADQQVDRALQYLRQVMEAALAPDYRQELRPSRDQLSDISLQIATLDAYKTLHECLHGLHLKLAFRPTSAAAADDEARLQELKTFREDIEKACATARRAITGLRADADGTQGELTWIAELERLAVQSGSGTEAADLLAGIQRLIRLQLSRLNKNIFDAANRLLLHRLIEVLPQDFSVEDFFIQFAHAIHELKTTLIARAIVHKVWQDAENELSLIEEFFAMPAGGASRIGEHWLTLRTQVLWLASLDPDAEWSKNAKAYSEQIDLQLTAEKFEGVRPSFETYCRLVKFRFFAIDATLKADCGSLGKFHPQLKRMVEEISHG
jgi:hypothetical protein